MVPVVGVDHASTTAFTMEANTVPVSGLIPVPKQLDSAGSRGLEIPPTVNYHAVLTIVVADYWSLSTCLVYYRPHCLMP